MNTNQDTLHQMVERIEHAGLRTPVALLLDLFGPLDIISSQIAQFSHPLVRGTSLDSYAKVLADVASWQVLRSLLSRQ